MKPDCTVLRDRWLAAWPAALDTWSRYTRLKAPVKRVCALQVPIPYSPVLENHVFPDRNRIIAGIREVLRGGRSAAA